MERIFFMKSFREYLKENDDYRKQFIFSLIQLGVSIVALTIVLLR